MFSSDAVSSPLTYSVDPKGLQSSLDSTAATSGVYPGLFNVGRRGVLEKTPRTGCQFTKLLSTLIMQHFKRQI